MVVKKECMNSKKAYEQSPYQVLYLVISTQLAILLFVCFAIAIQGSKKSVTLHCSSEAFLFLVFKLKVPISPMGEPSPRDIFF